METKKIPYLEYDRLRTKLNRRISRMERDNIELQRQLFMKGIDVEVVLQQLEYSEAMVSHLRDQIIILNKRIEDIENGRQKTP